MAWTCRPAPQPRSSARWPSLSPSTFKSIVCILYRLPVNFRAFACRAFPFEFGEDALAPGAPIGGAHLRIVEHLRDGLGECRRVRVLHHDAGISHDFRQRAAIGRDH